MTVTTKRAEEEKKCNKGASLVLPIGEIALEKWCILSLSTIVGKKRAGAEDNLKSFQVAVNRSLCKETLQGWNNTLSPGTITLLA